MNINHTQYIDEVICDFMYFNDEEATDFLLNPDNFQPFHIGLTEAIIKSGYSKNPEDTNAKAAYLSDKLKAIGSSITSKTVASWFIGPQRPKIQSGYRQNMFEVCFALHFSYENVKWFFSHVYFDRCCNCHLIDEAVYYYCFIHELPYAKACELIAIIEEAPEVVPKETEVKANFTQYIQKQINIFQSDEELVSFLISQKYNFHTWNLSALSAINDFVLEILGSNDTKNTIDGLKKEVSYKLTPLYNFIHDNQMTKALISEPSQEYLILL